MVPENRCELPEGMISSAARKKMLIGCIEGCYVAGFRCMNCGKVFPGIAHDTGMQIGYDYCSLRCAKKATEHEKESRYLHRDQMSIFDAIERVR